MGRRLRVRTCEAAAQEDPRPHDDVKYRRDADYKPSNAPNRTRTAENADMELKIQASTTMAGAPTPRVNACVSFRTLLYTTIHSHTITTVFVQFSEPQLVETAASLRRSCVSLRAAEQVLGLKGGSARSKVGPARPAAHYIRSACCTDVSQLKQRPAGPARVELGSPCRRCARCAPGVRCAATDRCWASDDPACWISYNVTHGYITDCEVVPGDLAGRG